MKYIVFIFILSGCAAEVGKNNTADLQNENTALKVQHADLKVQLKSVSQDLEACRSYYKEGIRRPQN